MKFAEKMLWSCLVVLMVVFSLGATIMMLQNHRNLLETTINQNLSSFDIEVFSIENQLSENIKYVNDNYQSTILDQITYHLEQMRQFSNQQIGYILNQDNKVLFTNLDQSYQNFIHSSDKSIYYIQPIEDKYTLFATTKLYVLDQIYDLTLCYDISSCYLERNRQIQNFIVISIFLFILAYIIVRIISNYMTKSIKKLNFTSQRIAMGYYEERTKIESDDEIGELSRSFDQMATINEKTIHQLQENASQKEEFMGHFSHEIKTPMTAILGFADLLRSQDCDEETKQKAANYIYTEAERLENLSYALMDLLSISEQNIELEYISLQYIFKQLKKYYKNNNKIVFDEVDISVKAHKDLLFVLLRNLIDNSLKANATTISIQVKKQKHCITISVVDDGLGMNDAEIQKITEPFYMIDKSRSRSLGGAGLGLAIVKRICDVHHTTLSITSKVNQGTTISFYLEVSYE